MAALLLAATAAWGQWQHPGCDDVANDHFKYESLAQRGQATDPDMDEPLKMAFDADASGNVDVYYVERKGKLKVWRAATGKSELLGRLSVRGATGQAEEGLQGLALDPAFKSNRRVYLFYNPAGVESYRLSRFTLAGNALDMASEKILLQFPYEPLACCHNGGGMQFDAYGDLWLTTGGNGSNRGGPIDESAKHFSEEDGTSSTADLRGGILRIHPDDSPRGYSIPAGNFGAYFAAKARAAGDAALAAQYSDTALVKPELYVKGTRNAYTLSIDPVRRWITTGDVGPDNGAVMEEHNLFKAPAFAGWPYFAGANLSYAGNKNAGSPTNASKWNKGMKTLPPAQAALRSYATATSITGPIYRYDGDLASTRKLPPHFNRKWFIAEFKQNWLRVVTLDDAGERILKEEPIFANFRFTNPIDVQAGPDGALYVLNYAGYFNATSATSLLRISYTGTCRPALPKLETPSPVAAGGRRAAGNPANRSRLVWVGPDGSFLADTEPGLIALHGLDGREIFRAFSPGDGGRLDAPLRVRPGVYRARHLSGTRSTP